MLSDVRLRACAHCGASELEQYHQSAEHDICPYCLRYNAANPPKPDAWGPLVRCRCGGRYALGESDSGDPLIEHTLPTCDAYDRIETTDDAVRFSRDNREVLQPGGSEPFN